MIYPDLQHWKYEVAVYRYAEGRRVSTAILVGQADPAYMNERSTDLGGAPTEWRDAEALAVHVRDLVKHGDDPTPHLQHLKTLIQSAPDERRLSLQFFLGIVESYLDALARGSVDCEALKGHVESFDFHSGEIGMDSQGREVP